MGEVDSLIYELAKLKGRMEATIAYVSMRRERLFDCDEILTLLGGKPIKTEPDKKLLSEN